MSNRSINYCDPKRVIRSLGYARSGVHKSTLVNNSATARFVFMGAPGSVAQFKWSNFIDCDLKSYLYYTRGLTALWPYYRNNQLLQVCNATPTNVISQYDYGYDVAGRRISCAKSGSAFTQDDTVAYGYNSRSELTNAAAAVDSAYRYSYAFDDIGNREAATERGTNSFYAANKLNQYTSISNFVSSVSFVANEFSPQFDDDGNQALIKTATGVWQVLYNGENRPILWTQGTNTITMSYDRQGRRVTKNDQRFVYDGYQQIADNSQLLQVCNAFPTNVISQYDYTYDAAGRRVACGKSGSAFAQDDTLSYGYNNRSELTNAVAFVDSNYRYAYDFDDIGNRVTSSERCTNIVYAFNLLNQYAEVGGFTPEYDADGNQTLIKTATGVWQVQYNGENRPIRWVNGNAVITMSYDHMGRRIAKNGQGFVYDGYLQIADNSGNVYIWDPTEKVATRPLVWHRNTSSDSYYCCDGNKNVSEVVDANGEIVAHYEYAPFGVAIMQSGVASAVNSWRYSSEYVDYETSTMYYNYRHYEPVTGRWLSRDRLERFSKCLYSFVENTPLSRVDYIGLWRYPTDDEKKKGMILCDDKCEMSIYIPDDFDERMFPRDCAREHEQQHIDDLPKDAGCRKDEKGCCKEANMSPDANDYGGNDKLKESECAAYLVTAKCCTRKAGLMEGKSGDGNSYADMISYRNCVLNAKYQATGKLNYVSYTFGSPCNNEEEFNKLLEMFDEYFKKKGTL